MITSDGWSSRCESSGCVEAREVNGKVEVRSSLNPILTVEFTPAEWEAHEAALRAEVLKTVARVLLAEAKAYQEKWLGPDHSGEHVHWDKGYVRGMESAAHTVANSIDRPEQLTAVRDDTKGTSDG